MPRVAGKSALEIPKFDPNSQAVKESGLVVKTDTLKLTDDKGNVIGEEKYLIFDVQNRAQANAVLGGNDALMWQCFTRFLNDREKANARQKLYQSQETDEDRVSPAIVKLLESGLPGVDALAISTVVGALKVDENKAKEFVEKIKTKRAEQLAKRGKVA